MENQDQVIEPTQEPTPAPEPRDVIIDKIKKEKDNYRKALEEANARLKEVETNKLKEQNQYKELYDLAKKEKEEIESSYNGLIQERVISKKKEALEVELAKLGFKSERKNMIDKFVDLNEIKIDEESNSFYGVIDLANKFKASLPELFTAQQSTMNHSAPNSKTSPSMMTMDEFLKLPYEKRNDPAFKKEFYEKSLGITLKK